MFGLPCQWRYINVGTFNWFTNILKSKQTFSLPVSHPDGDFGALVLEIQCQWWHFFILLGLTWTNPGIYLAVLFTNRVKIAYSFLCPV